jgi:ATP-dependent RNA helicase SUPV3L1/SUV3
VTAVLGPTNTGKTHLAIERMLGHKAGIIGLPLRLLAREVYNKIVERVGAEHVALVTGEEKIKPDKARYFVATMEAMPRDLDVPFVAHDEIQIAADLERGHVFTDRLLNRRGSEETLLLGAATMKPIVEKLMPGLNVVSRPRLSNLVFSGEKKLTRLPRRTAIVAFSADEVYAIAELIRRQHGGAAVVLGALSPRTRNAQVAMYQHGDVDYLVATDAIGMGLNLDVDHVAFAGDRKFDGFQFRRLTPAELGQIAGRAGRHVRDGTFGTTGRCDGFVPELAEAIEGHAFDSVKVLQWRNPAPNFSSLEMLQDSLVASPVEPGLTRAPDADDMRALSLAARDEAVRDLAKGAEAVERLWDVAQVPDYRKISPHAHADLVTSLYGFLMRDGKVPDDWFARQVAFSDRTDGDIDTLSTRIAHIRTWTFAANRADWLKDPAHWQGVTRGVEDKLSDALHDRLAQRFVDRRTSVLMRRLRENAMLETEITRTGDVIVEGQHVGTLQGFQFAPDPSAGDGESGRALRAAAAKALAGEIEARSQRFSQAPDTEFALAIDGTVRWIGEPVAKLSGSDKILAPRMRLIADEELTGPAREAVQTRLDIFIASHIARLLGPLLLLDKAEELQGLARGIAFQLVEALGVLERPRVAEELKQLDQDQRAMLRKHGVRFGAYHVYLPALMKPAPRTLAAQLWALNHGGVEQKGLDEIPHLAASGRTSIPADKEIDKALYRIVGYKVCGERAVRVDILERLADIIRPAIAYRPGISVGEPPTGAADHDGFVTTVQMTSLVGCSGDDFASILKGLGYRSEKRKGPPIRQALRQPAATMPAVPGESGPQAPADPASAESAPAPEAEEMIVTPFGSGPEPGAAGVEPETQDSSAAPAEQNTTPADDPASAEPVAAPGDMVATPFGAGPDPQPSAEGAMIEDATAVETTQAATPPDAELEIEVWRPTRFDRHQRSQHRHHRGKVEKGERRQGAVARDAAAPQPGPAVPADGRERGAQDRWRRDKDRDKESGGRDGGRSRDSRDGRRSFEARRDGAASPQPNDERASRPGRDRRERLDRGPRAWSSEERGRENRAPDPNSPFAKLLALKEQLQRQKPEKGR